MDNIKQTCKIPDEFLFTKIFQSFRMAIQPSKLMIAFTALMLICLAGWIMDFSKTVVLSTKTQKSTSELDVYLLEPEIVRVHIERYSENGDREGVFVTLWKFSTQRFQWIINSIFTLNISGVFKNITDYFKAIAWAVKYHFIYCIIFAFIKLVIISIAGGSLCRMSALQLAKGEKPGFTEAIRFGLKKSKSLITAPLIPVGFIAFIGLFIFTAGLIINIPIIGELVTVVSMPVLLLGGVLITFTTIGLFAGWLLLFPAIAYDGSDCFDAVSRAFNYVFTRPWQLGFYSLLAAIYGSICYMFVKFFAFLLLFATHSFLQLGVWVNGSSGQTNKLISIWPRPNLIYLLSSFESVETNWSESLSAFLINLFLLIVIGLVASFVISFYFSASTIIYAALRKKVDNTAIEEVYATSEGD